MHLMFKFVRDIHNFNVYKKKLKTHIKKEAIYHEMSSRKLDARDRGQEVVSST